MFTCFFVDDELLVLESFMHKHAFFESGFINIGFSTNSLDSVNEILTVMPDVVFVDLKMPGLNGVELMDELKQSGYKGEFVIVSAHRDFEEARRFFTMDGFDYLVKPVSDKDLLMLLSKLSDRLSERKDKRKTNGDTPSVELNKITAYLHNNKTGKHTLESIGKTFHIKPNTVCTLFSKHLGTTFKAYLTRIRMEEAARLLLTTKKSVKEISFICGYDDYFYFCRVFREFYSCTPTAYREDTL